MQTLRLICDVAALRSFSLAAARHGVTQSAASQRIGQLERRLGVTLIDRSVRPLELTEAGAEFVAGCKALVEAYNELEERVARHAGKQRQVGGEVKVDAIYSAGIDLLNQVRESFEKAHPGVRVVVEYKRPEQVYEAVRRQECDLGILSYPQRWRGVGVIPLRDERMVVAAALGHPLAQRRTVRAAELDDWPLLTFEPDLPAGRSIHRYLREQGVEPRITAVFDNIDTIKTAVAVTQDHYTILPKRTLMREIAAGTLAVVELVPELVRPLGIIHARIGRGERHSSSLSPAAQAFVDHLLEHAGSKVNLTAGLEESRNPTMVGAKS